MPTYTLREEGFDFDHVEADSAEEALDTLPLDEDGSLMGGDYNTEDGTVWTRIYVFNTENRDDYASRSFHVHPKAPGCQGGQTHRWRSPLHLVGGLQENPGVFAHGGGIVIHEVCTCCGCGRTIDTWAQNPSTGEQGLESLHYEPKKYEEAIAC